MSKKSPQLRFEGFTDDWEERKLGDILSERNDQMPETNEYPLMSFVQGKGVTPKGERYNRSFLVKDSEKKYKKTKLGDFIYSSNNLETGSIGFNRTGKAVISPVYSIFESKKARESLFIGIMSARKDFISEMVRFRQGVVYGQWRIHESDFLNINIKIPNDKEQHLIISLFESIDNTIALHQRKLDLLKEQKKGYLQKMFPKNGAKVPELRFAGFADDWEERKLGELAKFSKGKGYTKGDLIEDGEPIILYGQLYTKYQTIITDVDTYVDMQENSILSEGSEVIVPSSGETSEDIARAAVVDNKGVVLGGDLNIIKPSKKLVSSFLALTISNGKAQKELMKKAQGNSVVHLYNTDLKEVKLFYPDNLEQNKIGNFFKQLDDTIALHQRKLDLLKERKKGFLQKMFV